MDTATRQLIREGLEEAYRHKPIEGGRCAFCGSEQGPFAMHLVEFSQDEDAELPDGFMPMSASFGRLRGSLPVCIRCAPPCRRCAIPIATRWTKKMVAALDASYPDRLILFGNGFCDHIHVWSDLVAKFRKVSFPPSSPFRV